MLHTISWKAFLNTTAIILAIYYSIILLRFYKAELKGLGKKLSRRQ
ncbi:MAG: hypothetical protein JST87_04725 [Bacteroidetes bacterium]|nr:hypothetical protein [Bacteroidota bacterium]